MATKTKTKKTKAASEPKKSKMQRIMFEKDITRSALHTATGIAQPTLSNLIKGQTKFRERTLRDIENFLKMPREQFLGFEEENKKD